MNNEFFAQVADYWTEHGQDNTLEAYRLSRELLIQEAQDGGLLDPDIGDQRFINDAYRHISGLCLKSGMMPLADRILREWWQDLGSRQYEKCKKYHRALPAFHLGMLFLQAMDHGMSFRWLLHTHADDVLNFHESGRAAGAANLQAIFGLDDRALENLTRIAEACREEAEKQGWNTISGFPEEVVRRFIGADPSYTHQTHGLLAKGEFPLSPGYLRALLYEMDKANSENSDDRKGKTLEDLAFYLFSLLPGCVPKRNVLAEGSSYEDDVIVRDLYRENSIISDTFGRHFLVECKHRKSPIEVSEVGYFLFRMKMQHTKFGVMFSNQGITVVIEGHRRELPVLR